MKLVVISGLSGAGKSTAMQLLEDLGYYCVDNLPLGLLPALTAEVEGPGRDPDYPMAVVVDARNATVAFERFPAVLETVRGRGVTCRVAFLEAADDILIKRFSETRRRHPLSGAERSLAESIRRERELLAPVRDLADIRIDTTRTRLHELRELIRQRVDERPLKSLSLLFESFGFKHGVPPEADFVFDVRCLPNPHWEPLLRALTGRDPEVVAFLESQPAVRRMTESLTGFLDAWIPSFQAENRAYLTVAVGCTGGRHRSVYLAGRLAEHFRESLDGVLVRHREVGE